MAELSKKLRKKLEARKAKLKERGSGNLIFLKAGDELRCRIKPVGAENEFGIEVRQFYLGSEIKGVISPITFGEPCSIMETFEELKASSDSDDVELANTFQPRSRYLISAVVYKDTKGKKVDPDASKKMIMLTNGMYEDLVDLFLDDEWGDFTDVEDGYDVKLSREGSGKTDTVYSVKPMKNTPTPKEYRDDIDLEEMVREMIPTYEATEGFINQFLGDENNDSDKEESEPKAKKKKKKKRSKKNRD